MSLNNRRPHFIGPPIAWAGVHWVVGVGLDDQGVAAEIFADLADTTVEVEPAIVGLVHEASITASHLLQRGVTAKDHARRLDAQSPGLLCLMLRRAAETEDREGEGVRTLQAWLAERARGGQVADVRQLVTHPARSARITPQIVSAA